MAPYKSNDSIIKHSIKNNRYVNPIILYPNPESDILNISLNSMIELEPVSIIESGGRLNKQRAIDLQEVSIDLGSYDTSLYFVVTDAGAY